MNVSLAQCRIAYAEIGWTGVYRVFLTSNGTLVVEGDGTTGNGTEQGVIRIDSADYQGIGKREAVRDIQRRFAEL